MNTVASSEMAERRVPDLDEVQAQATRAAHQVWLAGLGTVALMGQGLASAFNLLVNRGKTLEPLVSSGFSKAKSGVTSAAGGLANSVRRVPGAFKTAERSGEERAEMAREDLDDRIAEALQRFEIPTKKDFQSLSQRIEDLLSRIEKGMGEEEEEPESRRRLRRT
jgi:poly(hydroxyalkanoate) granule-associated protein